MTHEVVLHGYNVKPGSLQLGTFDSYGIEKIHVTADDEWAGLDILAVFHAPDSTATKVVVGADGMLAVPPEATAKQAGVGRIVFVGLAKNVQRITVDMGYNIKPHSDIEGDNPGTPTPDVVQQILANSNHAVSIATAAQEAAENARQAAEDAAKKAGEGAGGAAASAAAAKKSAEDAAASSERAAGKAEAAESSANAANESAKAAQTAQGSAENAAQTAADAAGAARQAAGEAAQSAEAAETAKQRAEDAAKKALEAKTGSENALQDADAAKDAASGYADAAAEKATAAAASEKNAAKSENSAADSAAAAKKSAEDADNTANSIKDSMAQISENKEAVSQLKEDTAALQKRQNVLVGSETGNPVSCNDAFAAPLCGLTVYGKSTQDGTPTPDAPVPIVSAGDGGSVSVKVTGANILYLPDIEESTVGGITYSVKNGVIKIKGTSTGKNVRLFRDIKLFIGTWIFNPNPVKGTESSNCYLDLTNSITIGVSIKNNNTNKPIKMTESYVKYPFYLNIESTAGSVIDMEWKPQMLLSDKLLPYSPYREQLLTLPTPNGLPGIPVTSGGNYTDQNGQQWVCDEVDLERGVKVQRVKRVDISSLDKSYWDFRSDTGADTSSTRYKNDAVMIDFKSNAPAMNNILPVGVANIKNTFRLVATPLYLYQFNLDVSEFPTVKSWTEYLEANTVLVIYALAIPIETPLTPAEIAAYKALTAYAPDTVVQASDGAGIKLDYQRDVNLVVKNLEDAIASMTTT